MSVMGVNAALSSVVPAANLLSLLVIDDERSIREACREIATARGFEVVTAGRRSGLSPYWIRKVMMSFSSTCGFRG